MHEIWLQVVECLKNAVYDAVLNIVHPSNEQSLDDLTFSETESTEGQAQGELTEEAGNINKPKNAVR